VRLSTTHISLSARLKDKPVRSRLIFQASRGFIFRRFSDNRDILNEFCLTLNTVGIFNLTGWGSFMAEKRNPSEKFVQRPMGVLPAFSKCSHAPVHAALSHLSRHSFLSDGGSACGEPSREGDA